MRLWIGDISFCVGFIPYSHTILLTIGLVRFSVLVLVGSIQTFQSPIFVSARLGSTWLSSTRIGSVRHKNMKSRVVGRRLGEIGSTEAKVKILLAVSGGSRGDVLLERTADYIHFRGLSGGPLGEKRGSLCPAGPIFQGKLVEKPCTFRILVTFLET
ncbi:hypothetical protein V1478_000467 [Vespula squamosa]|uniref:Uncharacterized protein n=1 Tax=Vespula squamosa TaxID=30214 RepID=A0ABD2C5J6_VESSQ